MKSSAAAFESKDVLYGRLRPYLNKVARPDFAGLCSAEFIVLPDTPQLRSAFLQYRLNSIDFVSFAGHLDEGDRPRVDFDQIGTFTVQLPPAAEQLRIVAKIEELFSDIDAGVAALERVRANLKRYRAAVLKAAVEGRLTEEWRKRNPAVETGAKLLERILMERRAKWEREQLRKFEEAGKVPPKGWKGKYEEPAPMRARPSIELPRDWCWAALGQTCSVERGKFQHRPRNEPRFFDGPYPFVQIGDLPREGGQITGYQQTVNDDGLSISRQFRAGTVLVAIVGATIGNTGVLAFDACAPDSLVAVEGPWDAVTRYADLFLRNQKLALRAQAAASGGQPNINLGLLQPLPIPLPPLAEQTEIVAEVDRRLSVADVAETQVEHALQRATRLRQAILKRAFEGRLVPQDPSDGAATHRATDTRVSRGKGSAGERRPRPKEFKIAKMILRDAVPASVYRYFAKRGHAEQFIAGRVRMGCLETYARSEDAARADAMEGRGEFSYMGLRPQAVFSVDTDDSREVAPSWGPIHVDSEETGWCYILCLGKSLDTVLASKWGGFVVRLSDPSLFLNRLADSAHAGGVLWSPLECGSVRYDSAPVLNRPPGPEDLVTQGCFTKRLGFATEQEFRILGRSVEQFKRGAPEKPPEYVVIDLGGPLSGAEILEL